MRRIWSRPWLFRRRPHDARCCDPLPATRFAPPEDTTATEPPEQRGLRRDGVRLLVADGAELPHTRFARIGEHLRAGDVLVVNTSATVPGQLDGHRAGRPIVVHVANRLADGTRVVELRTSPDAADAGAGRPCRRADRSARRRPARAARRPIPSPDSSPDRRGQPALAWRGSSCPDRLSDYLAEHARPISYGYLRDRFPIAAYQTIFALCPGSAEMPSAARPFSAELVAQLVARRRGLRADHPAHRGVFAGGARGTAGGVVRRSPATTADWSTPRGRGAAG